MAVEPRTSLLLEGFTIPASPQPPPDDANKKGPFAAPQLEAENRGSRRRFRDAPQEERVTR